MTRLYRPVGLYELAKILALGRRAFPPRLPEQPIFYPVLNEGYATEIASRWNTGDPNSGFVGFVTAFDVLDAAAARFPERVVGSDRHRELWVPAAEQAELEAGFLGPITVLAAWAGPRLSEALPAWRGSEGPVSAAALEALVELVRAGPLRGRALTADSED